MKQNRAIKIEQSPNNPVGYKQTEVGAIPHDWNLKPLGHLIFSVEYGSSAKSKTQGQVPVLRMGNLQNGKINWSNLVFTDNFHEIKKYQLYAGDVLFNRTNTPDLVGKTSIYKGEFPAIFAGYLIRISVDKSLLDSRFLNYILNTEFSKKYSAKVLSIAVGQANINCQKLKTYPIPLPPTFPEQHSIATALSDADANIESLEKLIAKKRAIKKGVMQELLTGKRRLPGFSGEWVGKKIKQFGDIVTGSTPLTGVKEFWNGDIPWVTPTDISNKKDIYASERQITILGLSSIRKLPINSVLITCIASIGKNAILRSEGACNQQINAIVPNKDHDADFLYYLIESRKQYLLGNAGITATMIISKKDFSELDFTVPLLPEQTAIANVLNDIDTDITAHEAKLSKARLIKQGMMQELLTGRIRLV